MPLLVFYPLLLLLYIHIFNNDESYYMLLIIWKMSRMIPKRGEKLPTIIEKKYNPLNIVVAPCTTTKRSVDNVQHFQDSEYLICLLK